MDFSHYLAEITRLRPPGMPDNLVVLQRVGSTNRLARAVIAEYELECQELAPGLFLAFEQTAGRGRLERSWSSPAGQGVYASRTLKLEPEQLQTLPLLVGVGLCRGLDPHLPTPCRLKWPNDLLVDGRKIGGILIETLVRPGDCALAVVGFGVNLSHTAEELPTEGATSLRLAGSRAGDVSLAQLTWDLVAAVERELAHLGDAAYAVQSYRERSLHQPGDRLTTQLEGRPVTGSFRGFDENGLLLLEVDGREHRLTSGEVIPAGIAGPPDEAAKASEE